MLGEVLRAERVGYPEDDPADGLDAVQQTRLLREVLGWALCTLEADPAVATARLASRLIALAQAVTADHEKNALRDAQVTRYGAEAEVLLSDPAYARGGGLLVVMDPATGAVLRVVPQL